MKLIIYVCLESNQNAAAVCRGAGEALLIEEVEVAPPKAWEVRIRVICTSLCHSDITYWKMKVQRKEYPIWYPCHGFGILMIISLLSWFRNRLIKLFTFLLSIRSPLQFSQGFLVMRHLGKFKDFMVIVFFFFERKKIMKMEMVYQWNWWDTKHWQKYCKILHWFHHLHQMTWHSKKITW